MPKLPNPNHCEKNSGILNGRVKAFSHLERGLLGKESKIQEKKYVVFNGTEDNSEEDSEFAGF